MAALTVDAVIDSMGFGRFNSKILFIIGMMWAVEGLEITLISLIAPRLQCEWGMSDFETALTSSAIFIGMGVGCAYWGWLADLYGRKTIIIASTLCMIYFAMLTSSAVNVIWFVITRFFVGFGVSGIGSGICYLVEFSTTPHRARIVIGCQIFFAFGNMFGAVISYLAMNRFGWRVFILLCASPLPLVFAFLLWLPESVRYLQNAGKFDSVIKVIHFMSKENGAPVPDTINEIEVEDSFDSDDNYEALLTKEYCKRLVTMVLLWSVAWFSYFSIVLLNTRVLQQTPFLTNAAYHIPSRNGTSPRCYMLTDVDYLQNIIVVFGELPGLLFFILVIEKVGRKKSLIIGYICTSISFFVLAFPLSKKVFTVMMFIGRAASTSLDQILYVYTSELFPTIVRNTALGLCTGIARCVLAVAPFFVDILIQNYYVPMIIILSTVTLLSSLLCILLPETTGKYLSNR